DRYLVDLEDHVAASQANIFGEGVRLHVLHDHTFAGRRAQTIRQVTRQWSHRDSELAFGRLLRVSVFLVIAQPITEKLVAISDGDVGLTRLSVPQVRDLCFRTGSNVGALVHQPVAI